MDMISETLIKSNQFQLFQNLFGMTIEIILLIALVSEDRAIKSLNNVETKCLIALFASHMVKLICESICIFVNGDMSVVWIQIHLYILAAFGDCACLFIFSIYEFEVLRKKAFVSNIVIYFTSFMCGFAFIMQAMSYTFTHWFSYVNEFGYYEYSRGYAIYLCIFIVVILFNWLLAMSFRKDLDSGEVNAWSLFILFPLLSVIINLFNYEIELYNICIALSMLFIYVCIHGRNTQMLILQEKELSDSSMKVMLSQIQPHFMYNSLNSIYYLIEKNPDLAKEALDEFSIYLRQNINALKTSDNIPIEREMDHVKSYLKLEKLRFDDELQFEIDMQVKSFSLPVLTVQPMVENAVKHGIGQKEGGGLIVIRTFEKENFYFVSVFDSGVGFDTSFLEEKKNTVGNWIKKNTDEENEKSTHIGIENVRNRLKLMCDGELKIESAPGKGTLVTIEIPKMRHSA